VQEGERGRGRNSHRDCREPRLRLVARSACGVAAASAVRPVAYRLLMLPLPATDVFIEGLPV
jgi:hypothetical protein